VLIVDDHEVVRLGLNTLLSQQPDIEVVGEAATASEAATQVGVLAPDVVLLDVRLPGGSGVEACHEIKSSHPGTRIVMLTSYTGDEVLFDAISAGADGYVLKQIGSQELVDAVRRVGAGENLLDPTLTARVFSRLRETRDQVESVAFSGLSNQEIQILALIADGRTNKDIGNALFLSEKTIRNYVSSILAKLGLTSRVQAAAYAARNNIERVAKRGS
jgi:DNA-binding NarL/FixJ family response regulator